MSTTASSLFFITIVAICPHLLKAFNLDQAIFEPQPKPKFLINATDDVFSQFMAIYQTGNIHPLRKVTELDILMGTLRPVVQESYQQFKADALLEKIARVESLLELTRKAHYTFVHLKALQKIDTDIGKNERKKRTDMLFSEFSDQVIGIVSTQIEDSLRSTMDHMLKAILITEKYVSQ